MARRRSGPELQVSTSFEAIRIAPECLVAAYERVMPIPRRPTRPTASLDVPPNAGVAGAETMRKGAERG